MRARAQRHDEKKMHVGINNNILRKYAQKIVNTKKKSTLLLRRPLLLLFHVNCLFFICDKSLLDFQFSNHYSKYST